MISAGIILFQRTSDGIKYLLLKHKKTGTHWGFPKGRMEKREKPEETALREIKEETGIELNKFVESFRLEDYYSFVNKENARVEKKVIYFLAEIKEGEIKLSEEHDKIAWFSFNEAFKLLDRQNLRELLKKAQERINSEK